MPEHVAFSFAGHNLTGRVVDEFLEAEYGQAPRRVLRVRTESGSSYHVPKADTNPI